MAFDGGNAVIHLAIVDRATVALEVPAPVLAQVIESQLNRDVAPVWGLQGVRVTAEPDVPPGAWGLYLLDDADQANALGYHELTRHGQPVGKVFVRTTIADGEKVSVTASHEAIELLIDPAINAAQQASDGTFYALEIADPVQDQTYLIDSIPVSDFVYPAWFEPFRAHRAGIQFDHLDVLTHPFQLTAGGYISVFPAHGGGWTQLFGSRLAASRYNPRRKHRAADRANRVAPPPPFAGPR